MSTQRGNSSKKRQQKHKNLTAFDPTKYVRSAKLAKDIISLAENPVGLCSRCAAIIAWRLQFHKYKKRNRPGKCEKCGSESAVHRSYYHVCDPCIRLHLICGKCKTHCGSQSGASPASSGHSAPTTDPERNLPISTQNTEHPQGASPEVAQVLSDNVPNASLQKSAVSDTKGKEDELEEIEIPTSSEGSDSECCSCHMNTSRLGDSSTNETSKRGKPWSAHAKRNAQRTFVLPPQAGSSTEAARSVADAERILSSLSERHRRRVLRYIESQPDKSSSLNPASEEVEDMAAILRKLRIEPMQSKTDRLDRLHSMPEVPGGKEGTSHKPPDIDGELGDLSDFDENEEEDDEFAEEDLE